MFTKKFWIDVTERAIKTFAQTLLATGALDVMSTDLATSLSTKAFGALLAAGVSVITSLASTGFGQRDSASLVDTKGDDGQGNIGTIILVTVVTVVLLIVVLKVFGLI